jgi:integrase
MATRRLTSTEEVRKLARPPGDLHRVSPNLFIRFGKRARTYYVVVRLPGGEHKQRREKIGRVDRLTLAEAEARASGIVDRVRRETENTASSGITTFNDVVESYRLETGCHQRRWRDKERRLQRWFIPAFGKKSFLDISRGEVNAVLNKIKSRRCADQTLVDLLVLEKHFTKMDSVPDNYQFRFRGGYMPWRATKVERDRTLSPKELTKLWIAAGDAGRFGIILKLALYSAQRLTKILSMRWKDVDLKTGDWTIPRVKGEKGAPKILGLPPAAVALIETQLIDGQVPLTPWVFHSVRGTGHMVSMTECKNDFQARLPGMERWVIHDLRRTACTLMQELAIPTQVSEKVLGHRLVGVMKIYAQHQYTLEMREALARLADHIHAIVEAGTAKAKAA